MEPRKLNVAFAFFPYGGNGGTSAEVPDIREWMTKTVLKLDKDPRVGVHGGKNFSDTPITMTRNAAVEWAKGVGADVLVMIDSDMGPDCELAEDPQAKPWWDTSFDFLYKHYDKGPCMIGAPYCGPEPTRSVYVFKLARSSNAPLDQKVDWRLDMYTREEAEVLAGIQNAAALPTGLVMIDLRLFDVLNHPYFEYEYKGDGPACPTCGCAKPGPRCEKASTEDVFTTRNMLFNSMAKLGYNPLYCNWDAWAKHWKPEGVRKPRSIKADQVERVYRESVLRGHKVGQQLINFDGGHAPASPDTPTHIEKSPTDPMTEAAIHAGLAVDVADQNRKALSADKAAANGRAKPIEVIEAEMWAKATFREGQSHLVDERVGPNELTGFVWLWIDTMNKDRETLTKLTQKVKERQGGRQLTCLEVGSWVGATALSICKGFSDDRDLLHCVDTWEGTPTDDSSNLAKTYGPKLLHSTFLFNCRREMGYTVKGNRIKSRPCRIVPHITDSLTAAKRDLAGETFDLIFLDAGHTYEELKADIEAWLPSLREGGIICGHDYGQLFPGVKQAVDEYAAKLNCNVFTQGVVWWMYRDEMSESEQAQEEVKEEKPKRSKKQAEEPASVN